MSKPSKKYAFLCVAAGLVVGLSVGVGMLVGSMATRSRQPEFVFPEIPVQAAASHGSSTFAMATGQVGDDTEGVFMLDFITGELQCLVVYPRTGTFQAKFGANVFRDLGSTAAARKKDPSYVMVVGRTDFRNQNVGRCVVYVADANTGKYVAYGVPWNRNAVNNNAQQGPTPMQILGRGTGRNVRR